MTLPKVVSPDQVSVLIDAFEELEPRLGLSRGALKMEPMIETTQAILDSGGESMLPKLLVAARGRCVAAHFGTYDYTASCDITAMHQSMRHPAWSGCRMRHTARRLSLVPRKPCPGRPAPR